MKRLVRVQDGKQWSNISMLRELNVLAAVNLDNVKPGSTDLADIILRESGLSDTWKVSSNLKPRSTFNAEDIISTITLIIIFSPRNYNLKLSVRFREDVKIDFKNPQNQAYNITIELKCQGDSKFKKLLPKEEYDVTNIDSGGQGIIDLVCDYLRRADALIH